MAAPKTYQQRFLRGFAVLLLLVAVAWIGWLSGKRSAGKLSGHADLGPLRFRVEGCSMAPTLLGPCLRVVCPACDHRFLVDAQCLHRADEQVVCSLCGERQNVIDWAAGDPPFHEGDLVVLWPDSDDKYQRGELVAARLEDTIRVKRVAAIPGDQVTAEDGRLWINGERLEDRLADPTLASPPDLVVDEDWRREQSRWAGESDGTAWHRDQQRHWVRSDSEQSAWLVYHHRNVHDHDRPSGVMDDYQYNAAVARQLDAVDRLILSGTLQTDGQVVLRVAFWSGDGVLVASSRFSETRPFRVSFHDGIPGAAPVSKQNPIAIGVLGGPASLQSLRVSRLVEYRFRASDDLSGYPMRIPPRHYYLVGDNVPFSIDSRTTGAVDTEKILGRVRFEARDRHH